MLSRQLDSRLRNCHASVRCRDWETNATVMQIFDATSTSHTTTTNKPFSYCRLPTAQQVTARDCIRSMFETRRYVQLYDALSKPPPATGANAPKYTSAVL